jgi:hypothetical protein
MAALILQIASAIADLGGKFRSLKRDRRDRIADLLMRISECIDEIASEVRGPSPMVPTDRCFELRTYYINLASVINAEIPANQVPELFRHLFHGIESRRFLERLYMIERGGVQLMAADKDAQSRALHNLDAASGTFRATANLLRAT